jgi:peptidoglycan/xylan/chitin deacetylase (PgdA/CDA1 family)
MRNGAADRAGDRLPWRPPLASAAALSLHAAAPPLLLVAPGEWPLALSAVAGAHAVLGVAGLIPNSQLVGPTIGHLPGRPPGLVSLSFDDGPDPDITPAVLDVLERHHARASFFMIGARAAAHPELVREVVRRGHDVENHTMLHRYRFALLGAAGQRRELEQAQDVLARLAGRAPRLARTPVGIRSPLTDFVLHQLGLRHASWTRRGLDTARADANAVLRRLSRGLRAGDILLLHDGNGARDGSGRPIVLDVLGRLLPTLARLGLRSVPVAQALTPAVAATPLGAPVASLR